MRDDKGASDKSGILAILLVVPAMVICCGGGGLLLAGAAGLFGALGGWLAGLGGIATVVTALGAVLIWRAIRRGRGLGAGECRADRDDVERGSTGKLIRVERNG